MTPPDQRPTTRSTARTLALAVTVALAVAAPATAHGGGDRSGPGAGAPHRSDDRGGSHQNGQGDGRGHRGQGKAHGRGKGHGREPGATTRPTRIALPAGFSSEAMTEHRGAIYVGSQVDGRILRVDVRTGKQTEVVAGREGIHANGIRFGRGHIVVAGGTTGKLFIYDERTGAPVRDYDLGGGFVNGVAIRGGTAYATDTLKHVIYAVPVDGQGEARTIALGGDFTPAELDLDGIVPAGRWLLTGQYGTGKLFLVDPATGTARAVDLGGATLPTNDGLLLEGNRLYVAENRGKVELVRLSRHGRSGRIVRTFPDETLRNPVDLARVRGHLYVLSANDLQNPQPTDIDEIIDLGRV